MLPDESHRVSDQVHGDEKYGGYTRNERIRCHGFDSMMTLTSLAVENRRGC